MCVNLIPLEKMKFHIKENEKFNRMFKEFKNEKELTNAFILKLAQSNLSKFHLKRQIKMMFKDYYKIKSKMEEKEKCHQI